MWSLHVLLVSVWVLWLPQWKNIHVGQIGNCKLPVKCVYVCLSVWSYWRLVQSVTLPLPYDSLHGEARKHSMQLIVEEEEGLKDG